ncbi:MAG: hypothetical protein RJA63_1015 [Pseudomonadota bacterium]|jgi:transposase
MKIPKREYTTEFKELAVKRVKDGQSPGAVAKELELVEQTLRNWVKAADAGTLSGPGIKQVTPEQMELSRLGAKGARLVAQKWPSSNYPACHAPSDPHAAAFFWHMPPQAASDLSVRIGRPQTKAQWAYQIRCVGSK